MARCIDADKLKHNWLFRGKDGEPYRKVIDEQPTADVVEVVRCKNCLDYDSHDHRCKYFNHGVAVNDDYCSRARERREK